MFGRGLNLACLFLLREDKKKKKFIKHEEPIFKKRFCDNFQLNVYLIVFGPTQKIGNTASKLGIFLWSKIIKSIWICRKLLEESKPCNEMDIFKHFVKQRIEMEHFIASENEGKRERFLRYWYYESMLNNQRNIPKTL